MSPLVLSVLFSTCRTPAPVLDRPRRLPQPSHWLRSRWSQTPCLDGTTRLLCKLEQPATDSGDGLCLSQTTPYTAVPCRGRLPDSPPASRWRSPGPRSAADHRRL